MLQARPHIHSQDVVVVTRELMRHIETSNGKDCLAQGFTWHAFCVHHDTIAIQDQIAKPAV